MSVRLKQLLAGVIGTAAFCLSGCREQPKISGPLGAATADELVERYKKAHDAKDIESLRSLFFWNAQGLTAGRGKYVEGEMMQLCEHRLKRVDYVAGPGPDADLGAEVIYHIPGEHQLDAMHGVIYGKILLVLANDTVVDPSYIVMQFDEGDGRYYIDILDLVFKDAVTALSEGRQPRYVGASLEKPPDARKGEKPRKFK